MPFKLYTAEQRNAALRLFAFLASSYAGGLFLYELDAMEVLRLVSWSIRPGLTVLTCIILCSIYIVIRGVSIGRALITCFIFCVPMFVDFFGFGTQAFLVVGIGITTVACCYAYVAIRGSHGGHFGFWSISAYIYCTYIFNAHYAYGHMSFFGSSYTI